MIERIRAARERQMWTVEDLANHAEVEQIDILRLESGDADKVSAKSLMCILSALCLSEKCDSNDQPRLLSTAQACLMLGIHRNTLLAWKDQNLVEAAKSDGQWWFSEQSISKRLKSDQDNKLLAKMAERES